MYIEIAKLYAENKISGVDENRSIQLAFKNYDEALKNSRENSDILSELKALNGL
jgi:hypothetical protein